MVIFIHRYDYQGLSDNPDDVGRTQIIIAKHRNGAIADIDMRFRAEEVRFVDESESLVNFSGAEAYQSAMNDDMPPFGPDPIGMPAPSNEFGMNNDFQ